MISITDRAAQLLKDRIAQAFMEAGGLDMMGISPEVTQALKEKVVKSCFEAGMGFRILATGGERGEARFSIKIDRKREGDEALEVDGVRVFADPASATQVSDRQLDYVDESQDGFALI